MLITTADFDEIVLNNPFLTEEKIGYGKYGLFWQYYIEYSPASLRFHGQNNSTCKYIIIKHNLSEKTFKVIREDDHIVILEFIGANGVETVTDPKKIRLVKRKIDKLKRIVKKDAKRHYKMIKNLGTLSGDFDLATTGKFIALLIPQIQSPEKDQILDQLKLAGTNPLDYFEDPRDTMYSNEKKILQSVFAKVLFDELQDAGALFVIDWKSSFEEVSEAFLPVFEQLNVPAGMLTNKPETYETSDFLEQLSDYLERYNKKMVMLGGVADTYLATFVDTKNVNELKRLGEKIQIEVRELKE